jgi:DNA-binding transcriptional MocR family regulator
MSDLVVKFQELEDSQAALKKIMTEFEHASDRVKENDDIWSNGHVADAMSSFASNWKDHREKLLKKMDDAYKHSEKCLQSWLKADSSLADSLHTHQSGGAGHSRAE